MEWFGIFTKKAIISQKCEFTVRVRAWAWAWAWIWIKVWVFVLGIGIPIMPDTTSKLSASMLMLFVATY